MMGRKTLLLTGLLLILAGSFPGAQDARQSEAFILQHRDITDIFPLVKPLISEDGSVSISGKPGVQAMTVTDRPETLEQIRELLARLDTPPRSIGIDIKLFRGLRTPRPETEAPQISNFSTRLRQALKFTEYEFIAGIMAESVEGEQSLLNLGDAYQVEFTVHSVNAQDRIVRLQPFSLGKVEVNADGQRRVVPVLQNALNLPDEIPTIMGATRAADSPSAIFLAISANILNGR